MYKTFNTRAAAISAGYSHTKPRVITTHQGFKIVVKAKGKVGIELDWPSDVHFDENLLSSEYGRAESVFLAQERNNLNRLGGFEVMLAPGELERSVLEAKKAIDLHLSEAN